MSPDIGNATKMVVGLETLTNGTKVESIVRYECEDGYLLDWVHNSSMINSHISILCLHGLADWSHTTLPQCIARKLIFL